MKKKIAWILCILMMLVLVPASFAEPAEEPKVLDAKTEETDESLDVNGDRPAAPEGFDAPEKDGTRKSDASMKTLKDGESVTFELNDGFTAVLSDGVMTVSGTGYLKGYNKTGDCPWDAYRAEITKVVFGDGITEIGVRLFWDCTNLTSIEFPEGLETIYDTFYGCTGLKNVTLPASVTYIGGTFPDCTALESFSAPGLVDIGDYTFQGTAIKSFELPKTLTYMSTLAFWKGAVESFTVEEGNETYTEKDGILFTDGGKTLFCYPAGRKTEHLRIPDGVQTVGDCGCASNPYFKSIDFNEATKLEYSAFTSCTALETLVLPDTITDIEACAFENCKSLQSIRFGRGLLTTGYRTFAGCSALASIDFGDTLNEIGGLCFAWCDSLTDVTLPANITAVGNGCFGECNRLESVTTTALTVIPYQTFLNDPSLSSLTLNDGVTEICRFAIYNTPSLKHLYVPASIRHVHDYGTDPRYTTVTVGNPELDPYGRSGWRKQEYITVTGLYNYDKAVEMAELVNEARAAEGLNPLKIDAEMTEFAMQRAMELSVLFSHTRPDGSAYYSPYMGSLWGENAAEFQVTPAEVMEAWMNSEGHRENILTSYYTRIGVGCVEVEGRCYWIQWFSRYSTDAFEKPANRTVTRRIGYAVDKFEDAYQTSEVIFWFGKEPEYSYLFQADTEEIALDPGETYEVRMTLTGCCEDKNGWHYNAPLPYAAEELQWSVADPAVASVENGVLTAKANGKTTLTVKTKNGYFSTTVPVTVGRPEIGSVAFVDGEVEYKGETPYVVYNGTAQTPRVVVLDTEGQLLEESDYTVTYHSNTEPGTAYVDVQRIEGGPVLNLWFKIYLPATTWTNVENVSNGILIQWAPVDGAAGYVIYRRAWNLTSSGWTEFLRWNNTTATQWIDTKAYAGTRYQYGVKAYFARRTDPVSGATIGGNVGDNYNLGVVGPLKTTVRITTRTLNSVTAGKRQLIVKWSGSKNFTGYDVQLATNSAFTRNVSTVRIADAKTYEKTVKSLKSKTTYYVRVRSYTVFEGMTYFGEWSNVLSAKVK